VIGQIREPITVRREHDLARKRQLDVGSNLHAPRAPYCHRARKSSHTLALLFVLPRSSMSRFASSAALALALASGACEPDTSRPPCAPGSPDCTDATSESAAADPRFVGPGLRTDTLPHWPMFRHDAQHSGRNGLAPAASGALQWTFLAAGGIWSSPAIALDGTIYVGSLDHNLYAIQPDGKLKWSFETLGYIFGSPAVAGDGTVYVGSVDGHLYAVREGALKWSVPLQNCAFSSPVLARDGTVYMGSNAWKLYAVTPRGE